MNVTFVYGMREVMLIALLAASLLWMLGLVIYEGLRRLFALFARPFVGTCERCGCRTNALTIRIVDNETTRVCRDRSGCSTRAP